MAPPISLPFIHDVLIRQRHPKSKIGNGFSTLLCLQCLHNTAHVQEWSVRDETLAGARQWAISYPQP